MYKGIHTVDLFITPKKIYAIDILFSSLCSELICEHPLKVMSKQNIRQQHKRVSYFSKDKKTLIPFQLILFASFKY
jgi:hypothetical protein